MGVGGSVGGSNEGGSGGETARARPHGRKGVQDVQGTARAWCAWDLGCPGAEECAVRPRGRPDLQKDVGGHLMSTRKPPKDPEQIGVLKCGERGDAQQWPFRDLSVGVRLLSLTVLPQGLIP